MRLRIYNVIKFIKSVWIENEYKIILVVGFLLVSGISFEFGLIQGKKGYNNPIIIEKTAQAPENDAQKLATMPSEAQNSAPEAAKEAATQTSSSKNCAFVGSRNSNKYYPPTCSYAKKIKPENLVCFKTEEEATNQGRTRSAGCK